MKKMLIITTRPHWYVGGIETYTNLLIKIFDKEYEITEVCIDTDVKSKIKKARIRRENVNTVKLKYSNFFNKNYRFSQKKWINSFIKNNNPNIIINNTPFFFWKSLSKKKNYIHVQHFNLKMYDVKKNRKKTTKFKLWLDMHFLKLLSNKNPLEEAYKVVLFPNTADLLKKNKNKFEISPAYDSKISNKISDKVKHDAIFVGSLNSVKDMDSLNFIASKINNKLIVIGDGEEKNKLNSKNIIFKGRLGWKATQKMLMESKVLVLTSKSEGMPLVLIEALSNGVPVILFDTFITAKKFQFDAGFIFKKNEITTFAKKVDEIINMKTRDWENLSKCAKKFANENFSIKSFKKKWKEVIEKE